MNQQTSNIINLSQYRKAATKTQKPVLEVKANPKTNRQGTTTGFTFHIPPYSNNDDLPPSAA